MCIACHIGTNDIQHQENPVTCLNDWTSFMLRVHFNIGSCVMGIIFYMSIERILNCPFTDLVEAKEAASAAGI